MVITHCLMTIYLVTTLWMVSQDPNPALQAPTSESFEELVCLPDSDEPESRDVDIPHCWDYHNHSKSWCLAACNNSLVYECLYGPVNKANIPDGMCGDYAAGYCSNKGGLYDACWGYGAC
jgi:hypothetical protein